jgi:uncharacterized protein
VSTDAVLRPAPVLTEDNHWYWDAAKEHRLVAQRCQGCGRLRHPPRPMCPRCRSIAFELVDLSGEGEVYSFSVVHHPRNPAFDYPIVAALVELAEGVRVVTNLVEVDTGDVRIGMPVKVTFVPTVDEWAVPVFRPAPATA